MHIYLQTARLTLRRFTREDVDLVTALDADPAVMRYITGGRPTPRDEIRDDYLPAWLAYYERGDRYGFWAAIENESATFIGWFHLRPQPGDPDDEPELGYRLVASAWGQGYATEGSRALIDKAFRELDVRRVYATTMAVNVASWRVMEKAGMGRIRAFHQEWPHRIEGEELGDFEYAITRDEWKRSTSGGYLAGRPAFPRSDLAVGRDRGHPHGRRPAHRHATPGPADPRQGRREVASTLVRWRD